MLCWAAAACLVIATGANATIIRVPGDQPTIQEGLDAAAGGDTVLVAPGTYFGSGNRDLRFHGIDRVLMSEEGANVTTVDRSSRATAFTFIGGETSPTVVDGFTITHCGGLTAAMGAYLG